MLKTDLQSKSLIRRQVRPDLETCKSFRRILIPLVADQIDDNRLGEDRDVVLAIDDVDPIGIAKGEETFGNAGDRASLAGEPVFEVKEVAGVSGTSDNSLAMKGNGGSGRPLTVDPRTGDLLVSDYKTGSEGGSIVILALVPMPRSLFPVIQKNP